MALIVQKNYTYRFRSKQQIRNNIISWFFYLLTVKNPSAFTRVEKEKINVDERGDGETFIS